jgi:hypothetical protein
LRHTNTHESRQVLQWQLREKYRVSASLLDFYKNTIFVGEEFVTCVLLLLQHSGMEMLRQISEAAVAVAPTQSHKSHKSSLFSLLLLVLC